MSDQVPNRLYYGDNLDIMREHIADASVDLIYLDPPFNSNATYNVLFRERGGNQSAAQITAFRRHLGVGTSNPKSHFAMSCKTVRPM